MTDENMKNLLQTLAGIEGGSSKNEKVLKENFSDYVDNMGAGQEEEHSNADMAHQTLRQMQDNVQELLDHCEQNGDVESWIVSKLSRASEAVESVHNYIKYGECDGKPAEQPMPAEPVAEPAPDSVAPSEEPMEPLTGSKDLDMDW